MKYGSTTGQLGAMPEGTLAVSSPPFPQPYSSGGGVNKEGYKNDKLRPGSEEKPFDLVGQRTYQGRGGDRAEGNLETLETGSVDLAISSPPFGGSTHAEHNPENMTAGKGERGGDGAKRVKQDYAPLDTEGNLQNMPTSDFDIAITSPPYNPPMSQGHNGSRGGKRGTEPSETGAFVKYGNSEGQIEGLSMEGFQTAISSPPYAGIRQDGGKIAKEDQGMTPYSDDPVDAWFTTRDQTNLGNMRDDEKGFTAAISSPPYEGSEGSPSLGSVNKDDWGKDGRDIAGRRGLSANYGETQGQIGHTTGGTFWSASRTILEQLYSVLTPGAHAIFVTGDFVRDKQRVRFGEQWKMLCEAVGFKCLHHHIAWKTETAGAQGLMFEEGHKELRSDRVSFFRRNHISNEQSRMHWPTVIDKEGYLARATIRLQEEFDKQTVAGKESKMFTQTRIEQVAQKTAWKDDGQPDYNPESAILNEDVWCFARP